MIVSMIKEGNSTTITTEITIQGSYNPEIIKALLNGINALEQLITLHRGLNYVEHTTD